MKPYLSIIIPYHNSSATIGPLLDSLSKSIGVPAYEVIVVDDGSKIVFSDESLVLSKRQTPNTKHYELRTIRLQTNKGPAVARNRGAAIAKGRFLVFLDGDVQVFPDTLKNLTKIYMDDPDIVAVTGVWTKEQRSSAFFPNFKALRDWSYWINERDKSGYYYLFSTRIASIKKAVFMRLGGFDEKYPAPLVEDIELTYRIARRYAIIFAPNVRVRHEFESFWPIAKKYFLRAYYWTKLYQRRKKFDPVATTIQEALTSLSGVGVVFFIGVFLLTYVGKLGTLSEITFWGLTIAVLVHLILIRTFLAFLYREKGLVFTIQGFFVGLVLYCFIFAGAIAGKIVHR